ncbi:unnamed protein product [Blepharisma stoltei]|uniref:Uncharacterized protein n=1 Tax=Blepharisma stoltei TaxID=1481888 RepID=A0AAU9JTC0_9CILI|nr:unnamed protein product [Blepharisma stoltei]
MENFDICLISGSVEDMLKKRAQLPLYFQVLKIKFIQQKYYKIEISDSCWIFNAVVSKTAAAKSSTNRDLSINCVIQVNSYDLITSKDGKDKIIALKEFIVVDNKLDIIGKPILINAVNYPCQGTPTNVSDNCSVASYNQSEKTPDRHQPHSQGIFTESHRIDQSIEDANKVLQEMKTSYDSRLSGLEKQIQELQITMEKLASSLKVNDKL